MAFGLHGMFANISNLVYYTYKLVSQTWVWRDSGYWWALTKDTV